MLGAQQGSHNMDWPTQLGAEIYVRGAPGDNRPIFLATRFIFIFVIIALFVSAYDLRNKIVKYREF